MKNKRNKIVHGGDGTNFVDVSITLGCESVS
jgi:hypothetical protein